MYKRSLFDEDDLELHRSSHCLCRCGSRSALAQLYYEAFGTDEVLDAETLRRRQYAEERAKERVIVRYGVGQVLGVR